MNRAIPSGPLRVVVLLTTCILAALLLATPPSSGLSVAQETSVASEVPEVAPTAGLHLTAFPSTLSDESTAPPLREFTDDATTADRAYWTDRAVEVRIGPASGYPVIALLPGGASLQIVGRDETSQWVGIVFAPYTGLTGWIVATSVSGQLEVSSLEVAPVTYLEIR